MTSKSLISELLANSEESADFIARRAAQRSKKLLTQWAAFVRMLARNMDLKVELTGGTPCTDGKTVWLRIPLELGLDIPHNKKLCGKRNGIRLTCLACEVDEDVTITILHEVSHIVFDSMAELEEAEKVKLLKKAIEAEAGDNADSSRPARIWAKLEKKRNVSFVEASNMVSPWLGLVLNAVEDVRVNARMMEARPGTKIMFQAQTERVFLDGVLRNDGTFSSWTEAPPNAQAIIAAYCKASGLELNGFLSDDVVEKLDSSTKFDDLCRRARTARSVRSEFEISVQLLEALRELGYCRVPDEEPEEDPGKGDDSEEPKDDSEEGSPGQPGDESEEGSEPGPNPDEDSESGSGGSGGSPSGEDRDDTEGGGESGGDDNPSGDDSEADSDDKDSDSEGACQESWSCKKEDGHDGECGEETDGAGGEGDGTDGDDGEAEGDLDNPEYSGKTYTEEDLARDGTPDEVEDLFKKFGRHDEESKGDTALMGGDPSDRESAAEKIDRALAQVDFFDSVSRTIYGVDVYTDFNDREAHAWNERYRHDDNLTLEVKESIMSPALMNLRRAFADNATAKRVSNLKSGKKLDGAVLGRRVPLDDPRVFKRRELPGKKDYFVLIGLDISGSTNRAGLIDLIKQSAYAQAELCRRLGVKFAVYAHTGRHGTEGMSLEIYQVKGPNDLWDAKAKQRLACISASMMNLDGHTLEYYRKVVQSVKATDRVLMYYTDGAMPCENYTEELTILEREIAICRKLNIKLVGVGVRNDDPTKYGLDTIRLDRIEDVPNLVKGLQKRLA